MTKYLDIDRAGLTLDINSIRFLKNNSHLCEYGYDYVDKGKY